MRKAKARRPRRVPGKMNKTEAKYAEHLEAQRLAGEIERWRYEPLRFRLANRTFYEIDFLVTQKDLELRCIDVKGRSGSGRGGWEDDARVKMKCAAEQYPEFHWVGVSPRPEGGWKEEFFS